MTGFTHAITLLSVDVFVGAKQTEKPDGSPLGCWFDLSEYRDKPAFIAAVKEFLRDELEVSHPDICFYQYSDDTLADEGLITKTSIDGRVWDYLSLDNVDAISMTRAFELLYPDEARALGSVQKIHAIASERSLGHHAKHEGFVAAYLASKSHTDKIPATFVFEGDVSTLMLSNKLMETHKTANNWYFADAHPL